MSDIPQKPRVRQHVEAAVKTKHHVAGMRRSADELGGMDPTGARWMRKDAAELEAKAETDLCRWSYATATPQVGNGSELIPLPEPAPITLPSMSASLPTCWRIQPQLSEWSWQQSPTRYHSA